MSMSNAKAIEEIHSLLQPLYLAIEEARRGEYILTVPWLYSTGHLSDLCQSVKSTCGTKAAQGVTSAFVWGISCGHTSAQIADAVTHALCPGKETVQ